MAYRIVICVDIEADSLELAYGKLFDFMGSDATAGRLRGDIDWESSDESYDGDGTLIDPDVLQEARLAVFADRNID